MVLIGSGKCKENGVYSFMRYVESASSLSLKLNIPFRFYSIAVLNAILSSFQITFLPEFQLVCVFLLIVCRVNPETLLFFVIIVLCTSVYAIPDPILRAASLDYPSIYTKGYSFVRLLDLLVVLLFLYALPKIRSCIIGGKVVLLYGVFFVSMFSLLFNSFFGVSDYGYFFFAVRNILIAAAFLLMLTRLPPDRIPSILVFSMFCWICKMLSMIILPSDNVIEREIFGVPWKIFFAGDEYLSFMLICAVVLQIGCFFYRADKLKRICYLMCFFALVLALVSQRKGAVPYFLFSFIMIFCFGRGVACRVFFSLALIVYSLVIFVFSGPAFELLPSGLMSSLAEYHLLYESAASSLNHIINASPFLSFFGVGPAGLYEVFNLPLEADHIFSFGVEVGEKYRYAIWTLPLDRLFLNSGIVGVVLVTVYMLLTLARGAGSAYVYISFSIIPLFGFYGLTPVSSIFVGFALYALMVQKTLEVSVQGKQ